MHDLAAGTEPSTKTQQKIRKKENDAVSAMQLFTTILCTPAEPSGIRRFVWHVAVQFSPLVNAAAQFCPPPIFR
jgi:hypothetical protein